jgi:hypothetical protein
VAPSISFFLLSDHVYKGSASKPRPRLPSSLMARNRRIRKRARTTTPSSPDQSHASSPCPSRSPSPEPTDKKSAFELSRSDNPVDEWLHSPPLVSVGDPILWWTAMEKTGHPLARMGIDFLSTPGKLVYALTMITIHTYPSYFY